MKYKRKIIVGIIVIILCVFSIIKFYKPNEVKAAYTHNFEKLDEYIDDDGKTVMRYNLYVEVSQNNSFNHVESNFDIIGLDLLGIEPQNGFVLEELELDSALTGHFSLTSNEVLINVEESNIENPNTGNSINIIISIIGVSIFVLINYYIKNRKKIYKI